MDDWEVDAIHWEPPDDIQSKLNAKIEGTPEWHEKQSDPKKFRLTLWDRFRLFWKNGWLFYLCLQVLVSFVSIYLIFAVLTYIIGRLGL